MATLALGAQAPLSPAKASHVPASATLLTSMTSLAAGSNCSGGSPGWLEGGFGCSVDETKPKLGDLRVPSFERPKERNLADVNTTASVNLTDVSTLQVVFTASVTLKPWARSAAGSDVSADVVVSVVNLAAVVPADALQNLQTLSQIGAAARGSVLEAIHEMAEGNSTVATFAANSAPDRLALIAAHTKVTSALTPAAAAVSPPVMSSPPAAAAAAATVVQAAGNGFSLIAGFERTSACHGSKRRIAEAIGAVDGSHQSCVCESEPISDEVSGSDAGETTLQPTTKTTGGRGSWQRGR